MTIKTKAKGIQVPKGIKAIIKSGPDEVEFNNGMIFGRPIKLKLKGNKNLEIRLKSIKASQYMLSNPEEKQWEFSGTIEYCGLKSFQEGSTCSGMYTLDGGWVDNP